MYRERDSVYIYIERGERERQCIYIERDSIYRERQCIQLTRAQTCDHTPHIFRTSSLAGGFFVGNILCMTETSIPHLIMSTQRLILYNCEMYICTDPMK